MDDKPSSGLGVRVRLAMGLLAVVTVAGLCFAWWYPEDTLWHFFIVTQLVPLFYLGLSWWIARHAPEDNDRA